MQSRKSDSEEYGEIIAPGTYELKWLREPHHVSPNWEIPTRIPHQRLQGLKRRGYLRFSPRRGWQISPEGEKRLAELRATGAAR